MGGVGDDSVSRGRWRDLTAVFARIGSARNPPELRFNRTGDRGTIRKVEPGLPVSEDISPPSGLLPHREGGKVGADGKIRWNRRTTALFACRPRRIAARGQCRQASLLQHVLIASLPIATPPDESAVAQAESGLLFEVRTVDIELNLMTESVDHAGPVEPLCVEPRTPIHDVLLMLRERHRPSALVCRDAKLVGVFTERDALRVMAQGLDMRQPVEQVMTHQPVTVQAGEKVGAAVQKMATGGYRRLPIVNAAGTPVGLVHVSGIVHYLVEHFPKTIYNLPPVAHPVMQQRECP